VIQLHIQQQTIDPNLMQTNKCAFLPAQSILQIAPDEQEFCKTFCTGIKHEDIVQIVMIMIVMIIFD
jgi:hypothetical protein